MEDFDLSGPPPPPLELRRVDERHPYIYAHAQYHLNDEPDQNGRTPLFYARTINAVQTFLENGADPFHRDNDGKTFLHFLFSADEFNSDMDTSNRLFSVLNTSLRYLRSRFALSEIFSLIDSVDSLGNTALHYATMYPHLDQQGYSTLVNWSELTIKNNEGLEAVDIARNNLVSDRPCPNCLTYIILIVQENDRRKRKEYRKEFAEKGKKAALLRKTVFGDAPDDVFNEVMKFLNGKKKGLKSKQKSKTNKKSKKSANKKSLKRKLKK